MNDEDIARVAHEVNRAYCRAIGDTGQPSWEAAPQWQRDSAISGVQFHRAHPHALPQDSHSNWVRQKLDDGWIFGEKKDPSANPPTHPCIMPYDQLPPEQRVKDHLFIAVVRSLAGEKRSGGVSEPLPASRR